MKRLTLLLFLATLARGFGAASLDLTPVPKTFQLEGAAGHCVEFHSFRPEKSIQYTPAWPLHGQADKAIFEIPMLGATGVVERTDTVHPLDLTDDAAVAEWVKGTLPPGVENVQIVNKVRSPVFLNGQPTVELQLTYSLYGLATSQAIVLARRASSDPSEVIRFEVETVHPDQFEKLSRALVASLYSITGF